MSELNEALGQGHHLEHDGEVYHCSPITQKIKLDYSEWLFARARDLAIAVKDTISKEEYKKKLDSLNSDYMEGVFDFEGELAAKSITTRAGIMQLGSLMFNLSRDDFINLLVQAPEKVDTIMKLAIEESIVRVKGEASKKK